MDKELKKITPSFKEISLKQSSFKSLYGLTPEVEQAIIHAINNKKKSGLKKLVEPLHPADQADMLERLSNENLNTFLDLLGKSLDPEVLVYLDQDIQENVIDHIGPIALARAIHDLDTDDAVDILQDLEEKDREVVIKQLPSSDRILVEEALSFPEQSAGRLMQREFLAFPSNWTVGQTIDHMRTKPLHEEETLSLIHI